VIAEANSVVGMIMPAFRTIAALRSRFSRETRIAASVCGGIILFAGITLLIIGSFPDRDREAIDHCTDRSVMAGISQDQAAKSCKHLVDMLRNEFHER
jgi:hypothetical protein